MGVGAQPDQTRPDQTRPDQTGDQCPNVHTCLSCLKAIIIALTVWRQQMNHYVSYTLSQRSLQLILPNI